MLKIIQNKLFWGLFLIFFTTSIAVAQDSQITVSSYATVNTIRNDTLNVRESAGIGFPILERLENGTRVLILDGPIVADNYTWWQLETPTEIIGWAVESADGLQTLIPDTENTLTIPVSDLSLPGQIAYLSYPDNTIRIMRNGTLYQSISTDTEGCGGDFIQFSPDGKYLTNFRRDNTGAGLVTVVDLLTDSEQTISPTGGEYLDFGWDFDWMPDSHHLVLSGSDIFANDPVEISLHDIVTGETHSVVPASEWHPARIRTSFDGDFIAFNEFLYEIAGGDVFVVNLTTGETVQQLSAGIDYDWSPTSNTLAYRLTNSLYTSTFSEEVSSATIYTSPEGFYPTQSMWSPDGSYIAFLDSNYDGTNDGTYISTLRLLDTQSDGESIVDLLLPFRIVRIEAWSPDSQYLIVGGEDISLWVVSVEDPRIARIDDGSCADWGIISTEQIVEVAPTDTVTPTNIPSILTPLTDHNRFYDGAYTACVGESFDIREADIIYINGILTNAESHANNLQMLCDFYPDKKVMGIYNATQIEGAGLTERIRWDVQQAINDSIEGETGVRPSINLFNVVIPYEEPNPAVDELVRYLLQNEHHISIIAHSQGAAIVSAALKRIERDHYQERSLDESIDVTSYGGFAMSFPEGPLVSTCEYSLDPIPNNFLNATQCYLDEGNFCFSRFLGGVAISPVGVQYHDFQNYFEQCFRNE